VMHPRLLPAGAAFRLRFTASPIRVAHGIAAVQTSQP
jgi:hypothetical protein